MKKRIISGLMALVMVLSLLPSGVFTAFAAEAENGEDGVPEDRIDYSELTENQYMSKVLLNSNYCGAANGWSTEEYVNSLQVQLGYYLEPMRAGPEVNLTESLQANRAFMASVGAWKVLTFDPGNITDDMLTEKDYYTAIIFNILDVQFNDNKFLELLNNDYGQMSRETMSIAVEIAEKFDNIDINKLNAKLDDSTKSEFINLLVERIPKENDKAFCESFGKGMTFVTTSLKTLNSVEEIAKTLSSYVLLAQLGNEVKGVLYALYQNCDSSNMAMKTALLETYTVCSDSLNAAIVGVIETGTQVFNTTFSAVVGTTWKACISAAANGFASWLLISQTIGKTISNFCFSSDSVVEHYYALNAVVEFEYLMVKTIKSLGETFKTNESKENANNFMKSVKVLFAAYDLGSKYVLDYVETVQTKGLLNQIRSCFGENETFDVYKDSIDYCKETRQKVKDSLINIEGYATYYEYDAPSAYKALFAPEKETPVYSKIEEPVYFEPTIFPEENIASVVGYKLKKDGTVSIISSHPSSCGKVQIPAEIAGRPVTTINSNVFSNNQTITSVEILGNVTTIGSNAFSGCSNLVNVILNDGLKTISSLAFYGTAITGITIPNTVIYMETPNSSEDRSAFCGANKLKTVIFEEGRTYIPQYALRDCSSVTNVVIPDGVTTIGSYAFSGCTGLADVLIPESVTTINSYAFSGCTALTEIEIPGSVTTINSNAFSGCSNLVNVILNDGLKTISSLAFYGTAITGITIPNTVIYMETPNSSEDRSAFCGANKLKTVIFEYGMLKIPQYALRDCSSVTNVVIPDGVTTIGSYAFSGCTGLADVLIPESVTTINSYAFSGCSNLKTIYAVKNTAGYNYAKNNNITVVEIICLHSATKEIVDSAVSCTEDGVIRKVCEICGETMETVVETATGHDFSVEQMLVYPSCKNDGLKKVFCSICGEVQTITISKLVHTFDDECDDSCNVCDFARTVEHNYEWIIDKQPTQFVDGVKHEECTNCHIKRNENTVIESTSGDSTGFGDLDGNGTVNIIDVQNLFAAVANGLTGEISLAVGDCDGDGTVNIIDVQKFFVAVANGEI